MDHPRNLALCIVLALGGLMRPAVAQQLRPSFFVPGVGLSVVGEDIRDGRRYNTRLFIFQNGLRLTADIHKRWQFYLKLETHFGINNIKTDEHRDFELAGTAGAELQYLFLNGWRLTGALVSGPGYISAENHKQKRGFLFSNSASLALYIPFGKRGLFLKPEVRFRHMSNAGLAEPNVGLDNVFLMLSLGSQNIKQPDRHAGRVSSL